MVDYADSGSLDVQKLLDLRGGEVGHGDDEIAAFGGFTSLPGEAGAEVGGGVITGHYEKVVESGYGAAGFGVDSLIEGVKDGGGGCAAKETPGSVFREFVVEGF
jgi:hypothetical protein